MIVYEELRGVLLFTSGNGRDYEFSRLVDLNRRSAIENLSLLSASQFKAIQQRKTLTSHELKSNEIFVLHSNDSPEVRLWSAAMGRDLLVLRSQVLSLSLCLCLSLP
jgi:hypothetical protein